MESHKRPLVSYSLTTKPAVARKRYLQGPKMHSQNEIIRGTRWGEERKKGSKNVVGYEVLIESSETNSR